MGQEKLYMGQESLIGWNRRSQLDGTEEVDITSKQDKFFGNKCPILTCVKTIVTRIVR
jgi:hypothetical protein